MAVIDFRHIARSLEQEVIPACHRYGMDVVIYNPLAGGLFSGKLKSAEMPTEGRFSSTAKSGELYRKRYFRDATFDALRLIENTAKKHNLTMLEIGLRWCTHHSALKMQNGGRDGVIIGVSSYDQLVSNLTDLEKGPLPEDVLKDLDEAWMVTKSDHTTILASGPGIQVRYAEGAFWAQGVCLKLLLGEIALPHALVWSVVAFVLKNTFKQVPLLSSCCNEGPK